MEGLNEMPNENDGPFGPYEFADVVNSVIGWESDLVKEAYKEVAPLTGDISRGVGITVIVHSICSVM